MAQFDSVSFPQGFDSEEFTSPSTQATYVYYASKKSWIFSSAQVSGGRITISPTAPEDPILTDIWINENDYSMYVWNEIYDPNFDPEPTGSWIGLTNMGITASVSIGPEPPIYTQKGALWYNSETGDLKVRYEYGTESVWVAVTNNGLVQNSDGQVLDVQAILNNLAVRVKSLEDLEYLSI